MKTDKEIDVEALSKRVEQIREKIFDMSRLSAVVSEAQVFVALPPMFCWPTAIWDELEADLDMNAVPGGPELWKRVRGNEMFFTEHEIFMIYTMLGLPQPQISVDANLDIAPGNVELS